MSKRKKEEVSFYNITKTKNLCGTFFLPFVISLSIRARACVCVNDVESIRIDLHFCTNEKRAFMRMYVGRRA